MSKSLFECTNLNWDAMLNVANSVLEPITFVFFSLKKVSEVEFLTFLRYISNANNKYLKTYDPKQESQHSIYLDANNLYGYGMSKFLPTSGFKWIDP